MKDRFDSTRPAYEVFALRYATHEARRSGENYLGEDPHDDISMPLDFYVWVLRGAGRTVLVDTGCDAATARKRNRRYLHSPVDLLGELGIGPLDVDTVIVTHMHYDHAGNIGAFPNATLHIQESEMHYCAGRCMCHAALRKPFESKDVAAAIERLHEGRVAFANGDSEIAPGISVHLLGGHTAGLQVVRANTARGNIVLASDAAHYWDHVKSKRPFPIVLDVARMLDGHRAIEALADGPDHVIPGHDPAVRLRFPSLRGQPDIVALHAAPLADAGEAALARARDGTRAPLLETGDVQ
jgi:glyoxylase-like metal-dependent hydrolase (beta-lactamase superfamily II)